jgi:cell division protein ZapB
MEIGRLEDQVNALVSAYARLREENASLRQRQDALMLERADLIEKTELARTRVEAIISRLKFMESGS